MRYETPRDNPTTQLDRQTTAACALCWMVSAVEDVVDQAAESLGKEDIADKLEQHGEAFTGFLGDVQATLLSQLNAQSVGPEGFVENVQGEHDEAIRR